MIHESVSTAAPGLGGAAGKHRQLNTERAENKSEAVHWRWMQHVYTDILSESCNSPNREEMLVIYILSTNHVVELLKSMWICFHDLLGVISFC